MKRFLALILVLALAVCCFAACGKKDEADGKETGDKAPAYESQVEVDGGTIELQTTVDGTTLYASAVVKDNPGIAAFVMNVEFDNTKCTVKDFTASDLVDYENILSNIHQYDDRSAFNSASAIWSNAENITGDGVLFTLAFDIIDASAEDFGLKLVFEKDSFANSDLESVLFTAK